MTSATERVVAAAASAPLRKRHGRHVPAGKLTPTERRFVDALLSGASTLTAAYTTATGATGTAARVGGSRTLARPEVTAALGDEIKRMRTFGAWRGMKRLVHLTDHAKSEYVQKESATFLVSAEGHGPKADTGRGNIAAVSISIDLGGGQTRALSVQPIDVTPQPTDEQG